MSATQSARPLGRRERSKQRVRDAIYSAALALFAEQGYDRTTIDQITEHADVARGTFFNYFQRKEDLVTAWAEDRAVRLEACMEESLHSEDDVTVHLTRCVTALAEFNEAELAYAPAMVEAWVKAGRPLTEEPYTGRIFARIIEEGRRQGQISTDVDPLRVGNLLRDSYLGVLYRWSRDPAAAAPLHTELRELLRIVLDGVLAHPRVAPSRAGGGDR
ncbi:TetR/AcrR family transcriptional regulator [Streptomyces sp. SID5910]|uniref:TetR/AcrR family transcriptional regulator n=1 Tax=Streptomyces sp. SID5910 TaxID=2690312 RepID=UPI001368C8CB|nr:TetR/AcrR family transcriptional regulator [Streptomyces sp. SID5910]MYR45915.1 TetR family transcriptional regulator [Streptomyces sp. SID5910]